MKLVLSFSREDLGKLPIMVIVEGWHRFVGHGAGGKQRKAYSAEFSLQERKLLSSYYTRYFYRWMMSTGLPGCFTFRKIDTIRLIERAGNFFGSN